MLKKFPAYASPLWYFAGHNSMIYFVDDVGPSPLAQNVAFRDLPLRDVGQHPLLLTFKLKISSAFSTDSYSFYTIGHYVVF